IRNARHGAWGRSVFFSSRAPQRAVGERSPQRSEAERSPQRSRRRSAPRSAAKRSGLLLDHPDLVSADEDLVAAGRIPGGAATERGPAVDDQVRPVGALEVLDPPLAFAEEDAGMAEAHPLVAGQRDVTFDPGPADTRAALLALGHRETEIGAAVGADEI